MKGNVLIMAGGTGGHVFPALACAREFQARGYAVHWLGTPRGIENDLVPKAGLPLHLIQVSGLRGKGLKSLVKAPLEAAQVAVPGAAGDPPAEAGLRARPGWLCHRPGRPGCAPQRRAAGDPRAERRGRHRQPQPGADRQARLRGIPGYLPGQ